MGQITLPEWPWHTVQGLADRWGTRVWLVGGALRDVLLGRTVHDWDYVAQREALALARATANALGGAFYALDAARGVGRVLVQGPDGRRLVLDFALLRAPTLDADLCARDFTINALALDNTGALADPTGGLGDLDARLLRATHAAAFRDDPVRLLRAVRLAAELHFTVEPETAARLQAEASLLPLAARERVRDELLRLLELRNSVAALVHAAEVGLLASVLPEVVATQGVGQSHPHRFDVFQHTVRVVDAVEGILDMLNGREFGARQPAGAPAWGWSGLQSVLAPFVSRLQDHLAQPTSQAGTDRAILLKLSALLHDIGKPQTRSEGEDGRIHFYGHEAAGSQLAEERLRELRFTRDETLRVATVISGHMRLSHLAEGGPVTPRAVHRYYRALGDAGVETVLLSLADHLATWGPHLVEARFAQRLAAAQVLLEHYLEHHEQTIAPPPLLTGRDVMAELGLAAGPRVGFVLREVLEAQAAGEVNTREQALALARRLALDNMQQPG